MARLGRAAAWTRQGWRQSIDFEKKYKFSVKPNSTACRRAIRHLVCLM